MQEDFHYYATYCAAFLAGFSHEESLDICYSAQLVDLCSVSFLSGLDAPLIAATTQLQLEMMDTVANITELQNITRIWASFHFLPYDLYVTKEKRNKRYMEKYRLICGPNGELVKKTVELAKDKSLQHYGIAMHVLADTWAHRYFAGTPSLVINNTDRDFFEFIEEDGKEIKRRVKFRHNPSAPDDLENGIYTNSLFQGNERSIMNLGHGRAGHFPDYSFAKYVYTPAWGDYAEIVKDNPGDYKKAFFQMVYALRYLRGDTDSFETDTYDEQAKEKYTDRIDGILRVRRLNACEDWRAFGKELSGEDIPEFDIHRYQEQYLQTPKGKKREAYLGKFIKGAIAQKWLISNEIYNSGSKMAGFSKMILKQDEA